MVTCPEVLKWTDWMSGAGPVARSHIYEKIDEDAEIVAHRIGRDQRRFAVLTFYQAKYRHPDGTIEVGPASGPKSLVSVNEPLVASYAVAVGVIAVSSFWMMSRFPASRINSVHERY
jgi:hypothetical protein